MEAEWEDLEKQWNSSDHKRRIAYLCDAFICETTNPVILGIAAQKWVTIPARIAEMIENYSDLSQDAVEEMTELE